MAWVNVYDATQLLGYFYIIPLTMTTGITAIYYWTVVLFRFVVGIIVLLAGAAKRHYWYGGVE